MCCTTNLFTEIEWKIFLFNIIENCYRNTMIGNIEKEKDVERNEKSASPRKQPASPRQKDQASVQRVQAHAHQHNNTEPLYLQLIDKARWTDFLEGVVDTVKSTPKPAFNTTHVINNLKKYWLNYYAIFLGLLLLFAYVALRVLADLVLITNIVPLADLARDYFLFRY
jgi:hypothetical protein